MPELVAEDGEETSGRRLLDRDLFRVGSWLREFLAGSPHDEFGILLAGRSCGHSEADLREAAQVIGVRISDVDGWKIWSYREA